MTTHGLLVALLLSSVSFSLSNSNEQECLSHHQHNFLYSTTTTKASPTPQTSTYLKPAPTRLCENSTHFEVVDVDASGTGSSNVRDTIPLSKSRFSTFFKSSRDVFSLSFVADTSNWNCAKTIDENSQLLIVNLLTWQVGHLIVDVLQPLFNMLSYGDGDEISDVNRDTIILIQVANDEENAILDSLIKRDVYENDTPFRLLQLFTGHSIYSLSWYMNNIPGDLCMHGGVAVELDVSGSYHPLGYTAYRQGLTRTIDYDAVLGSETVQKAKEDYRRFREFIFENLPRTNNSRDADDLNNTTALEKAKKHITIIQRRGPRSLLNLDSVVEAVKTTISPNTEYRINVVILEDMSFQEQVREFSSTDLLISQYGSGAHNMIFMRENTSVIILTMPNWSDFHWPYTMQATVCSLNIAVCGEEKGPEREFRWSESGWDSGPWRTKDGGFHGSVEGVKKAIRNMGAVYIERETSKEAAPAALQDLPRLHVSDLQVLTIGGDNNDKAQKLTFVVEVITSKKFWSSTKGNEFRDQLENDEILVCLDSDFEKLGCFKPSQFNEFSTIDIVVPNEDQLSLEFYLLGGTLSDRETSRTFFFVKPDGFEWHGLGFSTVTHVGGANESVQERGAVVDWRVFEQNTKFVFAVEVDDVNGVDGATYQLSTDLSVPTGYQFNLREIYNSAIANGLPRSTAIEIVKILFYKILEFQSKYENIPKVQKMPTTSNPFVFLHHEKTAGSSLRRYITQAAKKHALKFYLPCFDGGGTYHEDLRCYSFDLNNATEDSGGALGNLSVMGGHFSWGVWATNDALSDPSCFIMMRPPVERAISLYYERVFPREDISENSSINDWSLEHWKWLLKEFKASAFGMYRDEGFCNTMCMMVLDRNFYKGKTPEEVMWKGGVLEFTEADIQLAKDRVDKCVIGLQSDWESTKLLLNKFFPWLTFRDDVMANTGMGRGAERADQLRSDIRDEIISCNYCDNELFEHGKKRFKELIEIAK